MQTTWKLSWREVAAYGRSSLLRGRMDKLASASAASIALLLHACGDMPANEQPRPGNICEPAERFAPATPQLLQSFEVAAHEHAESLAFGPSGELYVTLHLGAAVWARAADGAVSRWTLPYPAQDTRVNGVAVTAEGVFVLVRSPAAEQSGLWRLGAAPTITRVAALPAGAALNGLAANAAGEFFATDDQAGAIYVIRKGATLGELYLQHPLLRPLAGDGTEYGANGIRFQEGALYVTNSSRAMLLKIDPREAAPEPKVLVNAADLATIDDFAFDCDGSAYLASFLDDRVLRMTPQGVFSTVLDNSSGLLRQPSAVAFSNTGELYVTNSALFFTGPASVIRLPSR